jgi:protein-tyrosine-phosphatase
MGGRTAELPRTTNASTNEPDPSGGIVAAPDDATFEIVFVCTGNRFRSPLAAAVLEEVVGSLPVRVRSAGTLELGAAPALRAAIKHGERLGLDISSHRSRSIAGMDLSGADLVVGFEAAHVGAAVLEGNALRERAFLLAELVDLLSSLAPPPGPSPVQAARALLSRANASRHSGATLLASEIPDPLHGSARLARAVARDVQLLSVALARGLFGSDRLTIPPDPRLRRGARWSR